MTGRLTGSDRAELRLAGEASLPSWAGITPAVKLTVDIVIVHSARPAGTQETIKEQPDGKRTDK